MTYDSKALKKKLHRFGLADHAVSAAWPDWWSNDAEASVSANNELRFSVARKLGLDPRSLFGDEEPRFVWKDEAKYKHFSGRNDFEFAALTSFGMSFARAVINATSDVNLVEDYTPERIRRAILARYPAVELRGLIELCWGLGIPIVHLEVFPLAAKKMCAMAVNYNGRYAILLGRQSKFPAQIAYYVAHELGHIALGHLQENAAVVEMDEILSKSEDNDDEERAADEYALALLTGSKGPLFDVNTHKFSASELAKVCLQASTEFHIEAGTIALCVGHITQEWGKIFAAMNFIYDSSQPISRTVNQVARTQLDYSRLPMDLISYIDNVMGFSN